MRKTMLQSDIEPGDLVVELSFDERIIQYVCVTRLDGVVTWLEVDGSVITPHHQLLRKPIPKSVLVIVSADGRVRHRREVTIAEEGTLLGSVLGTLSE